MSSDPFQRQTVYMQAGAEIVKGGNSIDVPVLVT